MDAILLQYLITIWLCGQLVQQAAEVLKVWVAHLPRWENYVLLPGPQYSLLLMRSVFIAGASDETKPLVKSVRSSLPTVYPHLIKRHDWPVKTFNWQIRLKGNSKLFSGNSLGPLRDSNKGLGAAWQTLLAWIGLRLQRRLLAWYPVRFCILPIIPFVLRFSRLLLFFWHKVLAAKLMRNFQKIACVEVISGRNLEFSVYVEISRKKVTL